MGSTPARPGKLKTYLQLGRISNLPTLWTNVLAGLVLAGGQITASHFFILALSLSCSYIGGMFLNDAFDREHDRRVRPERPIPSGAASAQEVLTVGFGLLAAGFLLLLCFVHEGGWQLVAAGVMLVLLIVFYDLHHKQNPWSPIVMAGCRAMIYLIAAFSVGPVPPTPVIIGTAAIFSYTIGLSALARHESAPCPGPLWPYAFLFAPFAAVIPMSTWPPGTALMAVGLLGVIGLFTWRTMRGAGAQARQATGFWIASISLLDAWLIASQGRLDLVICMVIASALTGALQEWVKGT